MFSSAGAKAGLAKTFAVSRSGTFSVLLAVAMMMLVGVVAVAIDASTILTTRSAMQNSLDGAVLAAVQEDTPGEVEEKLRAFLSEFSGDDRHVKEFDVDIVSFNGTELVAEARGKVPMMVGSAVGVRPTQVTVRAAAARGGGGPAVVSRDYQELIFAVDMSGSLGIAATPEDRQRLEALTAQYMPQSHYGNNLPQGCAFACHRREGWEPDTRTMYEIARDNNIRLREDELVGQFAGLIDLLLDPEDQSVRDGKVKVTVVAFSNWPQTLISRSDSADEVKTVLDNFPKNQRWETYFGNAFSALNSMLGAQGDGTASDPRKTLIMITDGIELRDAFFAQSAMDDYPCKLIKDKGFDLAIVELKYPRLENNFLYRDTVEPVEAQISPNVRACSSPGWHFQAMGNSEVPEKFRELKSKIGGGGTGVRLTQ